MSRIRVGTCSWTDKTMVEAWYPANVKSAEDRLRYYAERFDTVEVDSTYYGLPSERNAELWAERTPPGFVFHIKAFGMLTRHGIRPQQLPVPLRSAYDLELAVGNEVIFVREDDAHRKVRLLIADLEHSGDSVAFTGHSLGSSVKGIKAAKRDETPVVVRGSMTRAGDGWTGELTAS